MTPISEANCSAHFVPVKGKLYRNKLHGDGGTIFRCVWVGKTFNVFEQDVFNTNGEKTDTIEFILDNRQIRCWEEYHEPKKYERWVVWWNHKQDNLEIHKPNMVTVIGRASVESYKKEYRVHKVEHLVLEFGTDGKAKEG